MVRFVPPFHVNVGFGAVCDAFNTKPFALQTAVSGPRSRFRLTTAMGRLAVYSQPLAISVTVSPTVVLFVGDATGVGELALFMIGAGVQLYDNPLDVPFTLAVKLVVCPAHNALSLAVIETLCT